VQAVGVSNYGPKQMQKIHRHLEKRGVPLASAQVQYSLLSRGPQQQEIRAVCQDLGVQMIAYSPLALGMLSGEALTRGICMRDQHSGAHGHSSAELKCALRQQRGPASATEPEICAQDTDALLYRTMLLCCCH